MRQLALGLALGAMLAGPAAAQGVASPYQSGFSMETSPLGRLSEEGRGWMLAETGRQARAPTSVAELDEAMEAAVGEELGTAGRRERFDKADLTSAMRYDILNKARQMIVLEIRARKKQDDGSDEAMLNIQALASRQNRLEALVQQANHRLTRKARTIISN